MLVFEVCGSLKVVIVESWFVHSTELLLLLFSTAVVGGRFFRHRVNGCGVKNSYVDRFFGKRLVEVADLDLWGSGRARKNVHHYGCQQATDKIKTVAWCTISRKQRIYHHSK